MNLSRLYSLSESYPQSVYLSTVARTYATINGLKTSRARRDNFKRFINAVYHELGILLLAYSGQRSFAEQWDLRKKYLAGGPRAAAPGYSWHPYGRALDTVPINVDGSANWKTRDYAKIHKIAARFGLENGITYGDPGHILDRRGTSLAQEQSLNPGWRAYDIKEDATGIKKTKSTEAPRRFTPSRIFLGVGIATGVFFGARYLYRRYA